MSVPDTPVTILLADDNNGVRDMLAHMLESHGYQVICAQDGNQALELLSSRSAPVLLFAGISNLTPRRGLSPSC
jgi:CheY-like chemotaxis protein